MDKKYLKVKKRSDIEKILLDKFSVNVGKETCPIQDAVNHFSARDYKSTFSIPSFRKSLVDGFAVHSKDVLGASPSNPVPLRLISTLKIGESYKEKLKRGETVYVPTGGVVPDGADSLVMIEHTQVQGDDEVFVFRSVSPHKNLIEVGEDVKKVTVILKKGERITPQKVALLRGFGLTEVEVFNKIPIGIISTGDELVDSGSLKTGKIYDINGYTLFSEALSSSIFLPKFYGIVKDREDKLQKALTKTLSENDIVIMSGGTSKGSFDFTVSVINKAGKPGVLIHGLHLSPGKPSVFGVVNQKLIVGLSGNPLASFLVFKYVVIPLIAKKIGLKVKKHTVFATLNANVPSRKGREEFIVVKLVKRSNEFFAEPIFSESAFISVFIEGSGIITIPLMSEGLIKGEKVEITLW